MGLGEGREVVAGDVTLVQDQREVGRSVRRAAGTEHPLQARPQGDDIWGIALLAAVVEGQTLLLIHHQGQGDLTQVSALLLVSATLWKARPAVEGMNEGIVVGGIIDQKSLSQGERARIRASNASWRGAKWASSNTSI